MTERERSHTFDNGMNIPDCYKNAEEGSDRFIIYQQYKDCIEKILKYNGPTFILVQELYEEDYDDHG